LKKLIYFLLAAFTLTASAQSENQLLRQDTVKPIIKWHQTNAFRMSVAPAFLIGSGLATIGRSKVGLNSHEVQEWRQDNFPRFDTDVDNYLPSAPLFIMAGLDASGVKSTNHWVYQGVLFWGANALNGLATKQVKHHAGIQRPDGKDRLSFPSAHTSSAFVAAEMLHQEFKDESVWISVAGYSLASAVGAMRILNNRHWFSDVVAGAGFGILSVRVTYFVYDNTLKKWGPRFLKKNSIQGRPKGTRR
jgi:hypothetical protein